VQPALVIECGTNRGGSALFYAHLFDLLGKGRVLTIDVESMHQLSHAPGIRGGHGEMRAILDHPPSNGMAAETRLTGPAPKPKGAPFTSTNLDIDTGETLPILLTCLKSASGRRCAHVVRLSREE
jgi:hypothetical protein